MPPDDVEHLFVGVEFVGAHIYNGLAQVGHHIVLRAGLNNRSLHHGGTEKVAHPFKTVVANPAQVVEHLVECVHALAPCRMSALAPGGHVYHHQSFLSHRRLHARWLTHNGHIHAGQQGQHASNAIGSRHLFFARGQEDEGEWRVESGEFRVWSGEFPSPGRG